MGPLKDRDLSESRRAPIPGTLIGYLRDVHIPQYCKRRRRGLLFEHRGKPYDLAMFSRDVWDPARPVVLPPDPDLAPDDPHQPRLSWLRRHDLRHAACSVWLNTPNIDEKIAQRWSGHRTLSVFLDIYQGNMPGRELETGQPRSKLFVLHHQLGHELVRRRQLLKSPARAWRSFPDPSGRSR